MRGLLILTIVGLLALSGCGDDDSSDGGAAGDSTSDAAESEPTSSGDDGGATSAGAGPVGTATIDGTEYTLTASLQCLVAIDAANQISISGTVEGNSSDDLVHFSYDWDSDDDINEFFLDVDETLEFSTFPEMAEMEDPQVDGQSVTASGMVMSGGADPVPATFAMNCG